MDPSLSDRGNISPLPENHRRGLIILTGISFLSFISTSFLWILITCKIVTYRVYAFRERRRKAIERRGRQHEVPEIPDLTLGLDFEAYRGGEPTTVEMLDELAKRREQELADQQRQQLADQTPTTIAKLSEKTNPFPILVYNLLLADMLEALAYVLSIDWVIQDGIFAPSSTCWVQGWLGSISNLAASLFLSAISVNTFLTIVMGYKMRRWILYILLSGIWLFTLFLNAAGVLQSEHGTMRTASGESYFMRANVWVSPYSRIH